LSQTFIGVKSILTELYHSFQVGFHSGRAFLLIISSTGFSIYSCLKFSDSIAHKSHLVGHFALCHVALFTKSTYLAWFQALLISSMKLLASIGVILPLPSHTISDKDNHFKLQYAHISNSHIASSNILEA
jgi:hypothetical protein